MGIDYSYNCILVENVRPLDTFDGKQVLLVDAQFEDEHEHPLAKLRDVLVVLEDGSADLEAYHEIFLPEESYMDRETNRKYSRLCQNHPGYSAYDTEAFGAQVLAAMQSKSA